MIEQGNAEKLWQLELLGDINVSQACFKAHCPQNLSFVDLLFEDGCRRRTQYT